MILLFFKSKLVFHKGNTFRIFQNVFKEINTWKTFLPLNNFKISFEIYIYISIFWKNIGEIISSTIKYG